MSRTLLTAALLLATTALAGGGWTTYRGDGFSIDIPPGWRANPKFEDDGYGFYQGFQDDRLFGAAFTPLTDPQPSSNLREPNPTLAVERLPPASRCSADAFIVDAAPDSFTAEPTSTANFARTVAEPGDLYGEEQQVFVVRTRPCVAVHLYIAYAQRSVKPERAYDRAALFGTFERMRRSVRIP
ncbi:MAG TPA: hypothetical protein VGF56_05070 [Rhizomicrobium sp.]|jgi:hypothetical protein